MSVSPFLIDDVEAPLHPYVHHALASVNPAILRNASWQADAIESGLADYFTCSFTNNPMLAEKSAHILRKARGKEPLPYLRNLDHKLSFTEIGPDAPMTTDARDAGEIWGGAFWEFVNWWGSNALTNFFFQLGRNCRMLTFGTTREGNFEPAPRASRRCRRQTNRTDQTVFKRRGIDV